MAKNDNLTDFLTDVANAIRQKKGTNEPINPQDFSSEIASIQSGGGSDMLQERVDQTNSCAYLFYKYSGTDLSFANKLDTSKVNDMTQMCGSCSSLTSLDLSSFDTSNVNNMDSCFIDCRNTTQLDISSWNTSKVKTMYRMFKGMGKVPSMDLSNFDTSEVENMSFMFDFNYSNTTNLNVSSFNTSKVKNMNNMFGRFGGTTLNLSNFDFSNVQNLSYFLYFCSNLVSVIADFNLQSCTNLNTFLYSSKLSELHLYNTNNVTNMSGLVMSNSLLETLDTIDMYSCTSASNMVGSCPKLKNLTLKNIKISLQIGSSTSWGHLLTNASLLNTAQELWDNTANALGGTRTLTMSTTSKTNIQGIYVKLATPTEEEIAADPYIENKKHCVECDSTDEGAMTLEEYIISKNWQIG